ncbi:MAG: 16S rRNA (cytidine(1402)-2'-O)-methyltransferase [Chloroflexi bacterium]|nr:16S rRNA (cytidine(1402)-2'-O)-methyltransferase [Chloroflexota bacterium]
MGILYLVATPLGNLEDITLRALRVLREVSLIATEDTRTTGQLLKHFELRCPMVSYYEHNKVTRLERVLEALAEGDVALVSEAGTPLFSDPGYELVRAAIERGFQVISIPGPSALTAALPASGLPMDRFLFLGFLPRKAGDRQRVLQEVVAEKATLVFFEAPHRLRESLNDMIDLLGGDRPIAVCRELTKLHEEIWRGTLMEARQEWKQREPRGEFTLVVGGAPPKPDWDQLQIEVSLAKAMAAGASVKDAVRQLAEWSGWGKREVYALAQKLKAAEAEETSHAHLKK